MREKYLAFLLQHGIQDTLHAIEEMSYTKKMNLLKELLVDYEPEIINRALNIYETNYIKINRVSLYAIKGFMTGLCGGALADKQRELDKYKRKV